MDKPADPVLAAMYSARLRWIDIVPGKSVQMLRPREAEMAGFIRTVDGTRGLYVDLDHVQRYAVDWRGFTEADLLGATVGVSDEMPFSAAVWAEAVADHAEWLRPATQGLLTIITEHIERRGEAEKNSDATLTPGPAQVASEAN